jgi:hypothetical protein
MPDARHRISRGAWPLIAVALVIGASDAALAQSRVPDPAEERFLAQAGAMMAALRQESRVDAARIVDAYRLASQYRPFEDRTALLSGSASGIVRPLPEDAGRFNIRPRLQGAHPIGEKDLPYQSLYVSAHPGTLGLLLHVAARSPSAALDVTSLVRHHAYQRALQRTNPNARTAQSMHAFGLAFDISILNIPLSAAVEIRDVLRQMRDDGSLFFIAETRQLVFHVVPNPRRLDLYAGMFEALTALPPPPPPVRRTPVAPLPPDAPPPPMLASVLGARPDPRWLALLCAVCGFAAVTRSWRQTRPPST